MSLQKLIEMFQFSCDNNYFQVWKIDFRKGQRIWNIFVRSENLKIKPNKHLLWLKTENNINIIRLLRIFSCYTSAKRYYFPSHSMIQCEQVSENKLKSKLSFLISQMKQLLILHKSKFVRVPKVMIMDKYYFEPEVYKLRNLRPETLDLKIANWHLNFALVKWCNILNIKNESKFIQYLTCSKLIIPISCS